MKLVIDIGNTRAKYAVFQGTELIKSFIYSHNDLPNQLDSILQEYPYITACIVSDVTNTGKNLLKNLSRLSLLYLNHDTPIPFKNDYATPTTLGKDRIALAAGAVTLYPNQNVLVVDAGSCITYDLIDSNKTFLGGAISPGISMRYRALSEFTAALPHLQPEVLKTQMGKSTTEAIHLGVMSGVVSEIESHIEQFDQEFENLTVILTGGDAEFLFNQLKSGIFVRQNFLLEGLNAILDHNT
jgi:type III pantothenate kinase